MAKSKTKKLREKMVREGKTDPSVMRLTWGVIDGVTKKTPTKKEKLNRLARKYKHYYDQKDYNGA